MEGGEGCVRVGGEGWEVKGEGDEGWEVRMRGEKWGSEGGGWEVS